MANLRTVANAIAYTLEDDGLTQISDIETVKETVLRVMRDFVNEFVDEDDEDE